jgi:hypothetical protein
MHVNTMAIKKNTKLTHLNRITVDEPLCKFESLYNRYLKSYIHNITNEFKDMEPKFWCLKHTKFDMKDVMICEKHLHVVIG